MTLTPEFRGWPKIGRLNRNVIVSEKIDGTNAAIIISNEYVPHGTGDQEIVNGGIVVNLFDTEDGLPWQPVWVGAQSRKNLITPEKDNFGFAQWVRENARTLVDDLGEGYHFGEWWGSGIQRGYGLEKGEKRLSLFNVKKWHPDFRDEGQSDFATDKLGVVPVLDVHTFDTNRVNVAVKMLKVTGSKASPGFFPARGCRGLSYCDQRPLQSHVR